MILALRLLACSLIVTVSCVATRQALAAWPAGFEPAAQGEIVAPDAKVELVWGEGEFTEGPALARDGAILFSDIGNRIYRFDPRTKAVKVFRDPSGRANGLAFDGRGRLVACEGANTGGGRRISITEPDGTVRTLADSFEGKRFNSPNDLAVDAAGRVYFSDPRYVGAEPRELDFEAVFLVDTDGRVKVATRDVQKPNGIAVAADGKTVFVADNNAAPGGNLHLLAFRVAADGTLADKRILHTFKDGQRGIDGMTLDAQGHIFATAGKGEESGIYVFAPDGKQLAFIAVPGTPTNCEFGGDGESQILYITAAIPNTQNKDASGEKHGLYRVPLLVMGRK